MMSLKFIQRYNYLSKNDSYAWIPSSGRNCRGDCFPRLEWTSRLEVSFALLLWQEGSWGSGSDHSWTTSKLNLLPEEMLKSDNPVDLPLTKPDSNTIQKSQTPLPLPERHISLVTWYSLWSGKEPLNTSPELLRLEGLWLLSSAGPPFSVIPFSPPSAPFTLSSSPGSFVFFFF